MERLEEWLGKHRAWVIAGFAAVTVAAAASATRIRSNNDFESWLPERDSVMQFYREVEDAFTAHAVVFVLLDFGDVFRPEALDRLGELTERLAEVEGVDRVLSLSNALDLRSDGETIYTGKLFDRLEAGRVPPGFREFVLGKEAYRDVLVSGNGRYALVVMNLESGVDDFVVVTRVEERLHEVAPDLEAQVGGDPAYAYYSDIYTQDDIQTLVPWALIGMAIVFYLGFKRLRWIVYPILAAFISILWLYGLKAATGGFVNILTPGVLLILLVTASDYSVYSVNYVAQNGRIAGFFRALGNPLVFSALTTIAGMASFATTGVSVLNDFGLSISFGLAVGLLVASVLMPALLGRARVEPIAQRASPGGWTRTSDRAVRWAVRHPWWVLGVAVVSFALLVPQSRNLRAKTGLAEVLPEGSPPLQTAEVINKEFSGAYPVLLYFKGDLADPVVLRAMWRTENFLRSQPEVGGAISVAGLLEQTRHLFTGERGLPRTAREAAMLYFFLEGDSFVESLVTPERDKGLVVAYLRAMDNASVNAMARKLDKFLAEEVAGPWLEIARHEDEEGLDTPPSASVAEWTERERAWVRAGGGYAEAEARAAAVEAEAASGIFAMPAREARKAWPDSAGRLVEFQAVQTGYPALTRRLDHLLYSSQVQTILIASLAVLVLVAISLRSLKGALLAMVPVWYPLGVTLGLMALTGRPLDYGSVLLGGIVLGLGVDGAIHFLISARGLLREGRSLDDAVGLTAQTVGRSFLMATASTLVGFSVLAFSDIQVAANLAITCATGISLVMISVFVLLPPLMRVSGFGAKP